MRQQCIKQQTFKHLAKHRTGSENAGGSPQEVSVSVARPTEVPAARVLFKASVYTSHTPITAD